MKALFSRVRKYISWGMPVAGALLLAAGAWSQDFQAIAPQRSAELARRQLLESRVRQALRDDPVLSHCSLQAKQVQSGFEIAGIVPDEAAHTRALLLIQTRTNLPIVDMLKVQMIRNPHVSPYHQVGEKTVAGDRGTTMEPPLAATTAQPRGGITSAVFMSGPPALSERGYQTGGAVILAQATEVKASSRLIPQPSPVSAGQGAYETTGTVTFHAPSPVTTNAVSRVQSPSTAKAINNVPSTLTTDTVGKIQRTSTAGAVSNVPSTSTTNAVNLGDVPLDKLRATILGACGQSASSVTLRNRGTNKLVIEMNVGRAADAYDLGPKVLALAELVPYEVELNFHLTKNRP
jgi:hypothetical protein